MSAIIYIRVSSTDQVAGTSLLHQEAICRRFCQERGWPVMELFIDDGESGRHTQRPALIRALAFCKRNTPQVTAFVVVKVDRLARNAEDHLHIKRLLLKDGVSLHSVTEPLDDSPTGRFVETVLAAGSQLDNEIRIQRCADGMIARLESGICPFRPPVGYRPNSRHIRRGKKSLPDEPHPELFPIIQTALRHLLEGQEFSHSRFAAHLDSLGMSSVRGRFTTKKEAASIRGRYLSFYSGLLYNPWTRRYHRGRHTPMISEPEARYLRAMKVPYPRVRRKGWHSHAADLPLRQVAQCSACGFHLTGSVTTNRHGDRYPYYFCWHLTCPHHGKSIATHKVHSAFETLLSQILVRQEHLPLLVASLRQALDADKAPVVALTLPDVSTQAELHEKRRRVLDLAEAGVYTPTEAKERLAAVEDALANKAAPPDGLLESEVERAVQALVDLSQSLEKGWMQIAPDNRDKIRSALFPDGIHYDRGGSFLNPTLAPILAFNAAIRSGQAPETYLKKQDLNILLASLRDIAGIDGPTMP